MSSPFMTVISGLPMIAKLSPREFDVHCAPEATVVAPVAVLLKMHLFCRVAAPGRLLFKNGIRGELPLPYRFSSMAT